MDLPARRVFMKRFSTIGVPVLLFSTGVYCGQVPVAHANVYAYANHIVSTDSSLGGYSAANWAGELNSNAGYSFSSPANGQTGSGHYYLTPFEPAWVTDAVSVPGPVVLATVSPGATFVVQFSQSFAASTSSTVNGGFTLGIHTGVGITDTVPGNSSNGYSGSGVAGNPATTFNTRISYLAVGNGASWVWYAGETLNSAGSTVLNTQWTTPSSTLHTLQTAPPDAVVMTFNDPSAYYASTAVVPDGANNTVTPPAGTPTADPSKDFTGTLNSFNGEDYSQVMATLAGSAGGDWFNLSNTGLGDVTQIAFVVPSGASNPMYVQAVVGVVPEPASLSLLAVGGLALLVRRRFRPALRRGEH